MKGVKGFQKGHVLNIGKPCSDETKEKIGRANRKNTNIITCPICKKTRKVSNAYACRMAQENTSKRCYSCHKIEIKTKKKIPWRIRNIEKDRASSRKWQKENQEIMRIRKIKWREKNREHANEYARTYYEKTKKKRRLSLRISKLKRRDKGCNGYWSKDTLKILIEKYTDYQNNFICYICHKICNDSWEIDHIIPLSKHGTNHISNLAIACRTCNRKKSNKLLVEIIDSSS